MSSRSATSVFKFYDTTGLVPDLDDVIELFLELLSAASGTTCIVDGLDEFEDEDIERILKALKELLRNTKKGAKIFIASRGDPALNVTGLKTLQVTIGMNSTQADIRNYVETTILDKPRQLTTNNELMTTLKERLVSQPENM